MYASAVRRAVVNDSALVLLAFLIPFTLAGPVLVACSY